MSTKPKPVPWPDVVDLCDDLLEWLVANGHASRKEHHMTAAVKALAVERAGLVGPVARALIRLELYRVAGRREDMRSLARRFPQYELIFDYSVEEETERDIRAVVQRLKHIRRLLKNVVDRKVRRREPFPPLRYEDARRQDVLRARLFEGLQGVDHAAKELHQRFREFNPAATEYPLTLAGWKQFEKTIRKDLTKLGFVWPK